MQGVKLSVSLPDEDVEFLDVYMKRQLIRSRSAALHRAVQMLRESELSDAYRDAFEEWHESEDAALWDAASSDGVHEPT